MTFYSSKIVWDAIRSEIKFENCFIGSSGRRYAIENHKATVSKGQSLYLCRINVMIGNKPEETFKFFVLDEHTIKNFKESDRELIGTNIGARFLINEDFSKKCRTITKTQAPVKLEEFKKNGRPGD